jgi:WXG100 family type VII secretion target
MAGLSGYEIFLLASRSESPAALTQAADASKESRARIQKLSEDLRRLTAEMQGAWKGKASDRAAQAVQPIEQSLQRVQETLDKADTSLRAQAQAYGTFRQQVMPMATPEPPELNLLDQLTPWDTDNEVARKEWFEADAQNRRAYGEYSGLTGQNQATLPQMSAGPGGAAANTALQAVGASGLKAASAAPPQVKDSGATSASAASESAGDKASAPPSMGGGDKTSASNAGAPDGGPTGGAGTRTPALPGPGTPKQPGDRTTVADAPGTAGGLPLVPRPQAGTDSAHKSGVPKGDHLSGGGGIPVLPGIGDPTGTRGQRGSLDPVDRSSVVGKTLSNAPAVAGARGAVGKVGGPGMGGFGAPGAHGREEEDKEHKRTVYLEEEADALIGQLPGTVAPVIGEG